MPQIARVESEAAEGIGDIESLLRSVWGEHAIKPNVVYVPLVRLTYRWRGKRFNLRGLPPILHRLASKA